MVVVRHNCDSIDGTGAHTGGDSAPGLHQPWLAGVVAARLVARVAVRHPLGPGRLLLTLEPLQVSRAGYLSQAVVKSRSCRLSTHGRTHDRHRGTAFRTGS